MKKIFQNVCYILSLPAAIMAYVMVDNYRHAKKKIPKTKR